MSEPGRRPDDGLPPGQKLTDEMPVVHYGPVPRFRPAQWRLNVNGATADGGEHAFTMEELTALEHADVVADMHCVKRWTMPARHWRGVLGRTVIAVVPPAPDATHVMAWAEYGYSATIRLADLAHPDTVLATHLDGTVLSPERGFPLRLVLPDLYAWKGPKWLRGLEYLTEPRRGFWEERGFHVHGDPWQEQRYSYLE